MLVPLAKALLLERHGTIYEAEARDIRAPDEHALANGQVR